MFQIIKGFVVASIVFGFCGFSFAQDITEVPASFRTGFSDKTVINEKDLGKSVLENVQIERSTLVQALSVISYRGIPVGFEESNNDARPLIYLGKIEKTTVEEFLKRLIGKDSKYQWEIRDGVVNVFPKTEYRNKFFQQILETKAAKFSVAEKTSCSSLGRSLVKQPELAKILMNYKMSYQDGDASGFYVMTVGQTFKLNVHETNLRSALNQLIKESLVAKYWYIVQNRDAQKFQLGCVASNEATLKKSFFDTN